jgi:hypothetical protein
MSHDFADADPAADPIVAMRERPLVLDIGGEGRHPAAWNLNPSPVRTIGPRRGDPIPRRLAGRADAIPLPSRSVDLVLVERTPLNREALQEIARVIVPGGQIILRHAIPTRFDPHQLAKSLLPGPHHSQEITLFGRRLQETLWGGSCQF